VHERVAVRDTELAVEVTGSGEPVVVIQTALDRDELRPLATRLESGHQVVQFHRRGYGASGPAPGDPSVTGEAADCAALSRLLDLRPVHVVGASYSAAIALTLAATFPGLVRTLTVMEPPPVHVPSAAEFRAASTRLMSVHEERGSSAALDELQSMLVGPGWREVQERIRPGSVAAMERDAVTFLTSDVPALLSWAFGPGDARRITCPVLHVGGGASGPWFAEVREWVLALLPQAEDAVVEGAGHVLAATHTEEVTEIVAGFLARHPAT
jgi:pimeloyl-ACP methyl ester carboxylesterase